MRELGLLPFLYIIFILIAVGFLLNMIHRFVKALEKISDTYIQKYNPE